MKDFFNFNVWGVKVFNINALFGSQSGIKPKKKEKKEEEITNRGMIFNNQVFLIILLQVYKHLDEKRK